MNNKYSGQMCPAQVNRSRFFTKFKISDEVENDLQKKLNVSRDEHLYRKLLQEQGSDILEKERESLLQNYGCSANGSGIEFLT